MDRVARVNTALAAVLKGAYKQEGFTLTTLSAATGIPATTMQRIMKGNSPVTMGDLDAIATAVKIPGAELFELALKKADRDEMSEAGTTPDALTKKREQRGAATKPDDPPQWTERSAATTKRGNPQLGADETPSP